MSEALKSRRLTFLLISCHNFKFTFLFRNPSYAKQNGLRSMYVNQFTSSLV
uniref:Uncharacterized protein n=1 Tax=Anguilla anguilla TaxID=7936 RepID=A0A0E9R596_ANGAN